MKQKRIYISLPQSMYSQAERKKILFLHGFFASGQCIPAISLKEALQSEAEVIAPDLPMHPSKALSAIRQLCDEAKIDLIVGNSCGAFYAQQIAEEKCIPALLGNPYFLMTEFLQSRLGQHQYKSVRRDGKQSFTIDQKLVDEFREIEQKQFASCSENMKEKVWGLFGTADTLAHFEPMFLQYYTNSHHFPGGHTPTSAEVKAYYAPLAKEMLSKAW